MFGKKKDEMTAMGTLIEGLPIPQNSDLTVKLSTEGLSILGCNQEFEIDISKLTLMDMKSDVEMEKVIHQSLPGMVIGAATFGVVGAMVGGRVKEKNKRVVTHFLLICYESGESKTIVIETTKDWYNAAKLVDLFRKLKPASKPIKVAL